MNLVSKGNINSFIALVKYPYIDIITNINILYNKNVSGGIVAINFHTHILPTMYIIPAYVHAQIYTSYILDTCSFKLFFFFSFYYIDLYLFTYSITSSLQLS